MINSFTKKFIDKEINGVRKIGRKYYLAEEELFEFAGKLNKELFSIGLFLGEDKREFIPQPALLEILAEQSDKKVFVEEKAEWLFLCKKDVFKTSIIKMKEGLKNNDFVLVQNRNDENLGLGKIIATKGRLLIKNVIDRGAYLRQRQ